MRFTTIRVSFVGALLFSVIAVAQPRRMELDDLGRVVRVTDPQIAPDGKSIVVVVSRANFDENRYDAELVLVDVASGSTRADEGSTRASASRAGRRSGDRLAFLASVVPTAGQPARAQILVMPMPGGDARRMTSAPEGVQQFVWSPDGRSFAYATRDEAEKKRASSGTTHSFEITNDDYPRPGAAARPTHIWIVPAEGGAAKRLTSGRGASRPAFRRARPHRRCRGRPMASSSPSPASRRRTPATSTAPRIHILDVATGSCAAADGTREVREPADVFTGRLALAFSQPRDGDTDNVNEILVAPVAGGAGTSLTRRSTAECARSLWMPDGQSLIVGANDGTRVSLWLQPLSGAARTARPRERQPGLVVLGRCRPSAATARWRSSAARPTVPAELYYMASPTRRAAPAHRPQRADSRRWRSGARR